MEKAKTEVIFLPKARKSILQLVIYIEQKGYPQGAEKFGNELYNFGYTLNNHPNKYPHCKQPKIAKRNMRCAVFHKNYMFVYKQVKNTLVIYNVIHCNTNPSFHSV